MDSRCNGDGSESVHRAIEVDQAQMQHSRASEAMLKVPRLASMTCRWKSMPMNRTNRTRRAVTAPATSASLADGASLVAGLRRHLAASTGQPVVLRETHISWVLLVGDWAYKLKKPVRLPFLDFSTPARRRYFCEEELRVNRRMAAELYVAVLPVFGSPSQPRLGRPDESGSAIDHVLCMRRFPEDALLSERAALGRLDERTLAKLALQLASFHAAAHDSKPLARAGRPSQVLETLRHLLQGLQPLAPQGRLAPLTGWFSRQQQAMPPLLDHRCEMGAVVECHGDLHLANVVALGDQAVAFDALEFDPSLRWTDTMADVGFLTMDLAAHRAPQLRWPFLDDYLAASGDHDGLSVLRFYEVNRALVRALVGCLSVPQRTAPDYLSLAVQLADGGPREPRLMITHGVSGCGKSWLSRRLLAPAQAIRLRSDVERKRLFGLRADEASAARGQQIYDADANRKTLAELARRARLSLQAGYPTIVDATFLHRHERDCMRELARSCGVPFTILECEAAPAVVLQRLSSRRGDASEATVDLLPAQWSSREPLAAQERSETLTVRTDAPIDFQRLALRWRRHG